MSLQLRATCGAETPRNRTWGLLTVALVASLVGAAPSAEAGEFDGTLTGTYRCRPALIKEARFKEGFSTDVQVTLRDSLVAGSLGACRAFTPTAKVR